jgi:hypothetical protein
MNGQAIKPIHSPPLSRRKDHRLVFPHYSPNFGFVANFYGRPSSSSSTHNQSVWMLRHGAPAPLRVNPKFGWPTKKAFPRAKKKNAFPGLRKGERRINRENCYRILSDAVFG